MLIAAATDRRIRCVAAQVPFISGLATRQRTSTPTAIADLDEKLAAEHAALARGASPTLVPCATTRRRPPAAPRTPTSSATVTTTAPLVNAITLASLGYRLEYEALPFVRYIAPTPLLMILADNDDITPTDIALAAFATAGEPKHHLTLPGDHYYPYLDGFAASSSAAADWFRKHLGSENR